MPTIEKNKQDIKKLSYKYQDNDVFTIIKDNKKLFHNYEILPNGINLDKLNVREELKKEHCIFDIDSPTFNFEKFLTVYSTYFYFERLYQSDYSYLKNSFINLVQTQDLSINNNIEINIKSPYLYYQGRYTLEFDLEVYSDASHKNKLETFDSYNINVYVPSSSIDDNSLMYNTYIKISSNQKHYKIPINISPYTSLMSSYTSFAFEKIRITNLGNAKLTNIKVYYGKEYILDKINETGLEYFYTFFNNQLSNNPQTIYNYMQYVYNQINYIRYIDEDITTNPKLINCFKKFNDKIVENKTNISSYITTISSKNIQDIVNSSLVSKFMYSGMLFNKVDKFLNANFHIDNTHLKKYVYVDKVEFSNTQAIIYLVAKIQNIRRLTQIYESEQPYEIYVDDILYKNQIFFKKNRQYNYWNNQIRYNIIGQEDNIPIYIIQFYINISKDLPYHNGIYIKLHEVEDNDGTKLSKLNNKHLINNEWLRIM